MTNKHYNFILFILDLRLALVWAPPKMTEVDDFGLNIVFQKIDELNLSRDIEKITPCARTFQPFPERAKRAEILRFGET